MITKFIESINAYLLDNTQFYSKLDCMATPFIVTKSPKSVGIAILLTVLFGPIGLLYASITGAIIMFVSPIFLLLLLVYGISQDNSALMNLSFGLLIFFALTYWLINIIWAVISVNSYNSELEYENNRQLELWESFNKKDQSQIVINVNQDSIKTHSSGDRINESSKPGFREWAKNNPSKSINDYYAKFGRQVINKWHIIYNDQLGKD